MRYPVIGRQPIRSVSIPKLSGGINMRDSATGIKDNQLTDSVNMWYKDGMLRTRPPFVTSLARLSNTDYDVSFEKTTTRFHSEIKPIYNGLECVCATNKSLKTDGDGQYIGRIDFEFQAAEKTFSLPSIEGITSTEDFTYFLVHFENAIYCYISNYTIYKLEYNDEKPTWEQVSLAESHIPTVMTHCKALNGELQGTQLDGYNLLTNSFKMIYSTVNMTALTDGKVDMEYPLLTAATLKNSTFKAKHTKISGTVTEHTVVCNSDSVNGTWYEVADTIPTDKLYMYVKISNNNNAVVGFALNKNVSTPTTASESDFIEDNLEITVIVQDTDNLELNKVFGAVKPIWFGGTGGIYSGSRLFLGANKDDDEKSLLVWSEFNNPLYFPENCYAYVGDKSTGITTFGRQDDKLIIFKENEIYYTYYSYSGVSADNLIDQTVVDYQASVAVFPIILLNAAIGCDCPDSVQMCRNRLVWAISQGRVYTLCKINQYNEHTVYEISEMVKPKLRNYKERLKTACSADFDGHYVLFLGDCAFLADYNSYGYQYIYSYSKTDDANLLLPWYYWDFSFLKSHETGDEYQSACVCMLGESLLMRAFFSASISEKSGFVAFEMKDSEYMPTDSIFYNDFIGRSLKLGDSNINCSATTKLFELGGGIYSFNPQSLSLKCGSNNGAEISVEILSDCGSEKNVFSQKKEYVSLSDTAFVKAKKIHPSIRAILKMGVRLECDGLLCVDGLSLQYRLLGDVK